MSKLQNLQKALNSSTGKPSKSAAVVSTVSPTAYTAPSREGKVNITAYLHPDYKSNLRLVQARKGGNISIQSMLEESLNDLFVKYDVPAVRLD